MIDTIYATKKGMSQVWDVNGKRLPVTKFVVEPNIVIGEVKTQVRTNKKDVHGWEEKRVVEIGYGDKKLKNMTKPMRARLEKLSLKNGAKTVHGVRENDGEALSVGAQVAWVEVLKVGDIVTVQGATKGRGFAGGVKRYGFRGGPKTHGQADRWRAVGSVGNRTTPGRVWLGKRLPGHMGVATQTVKGLVVAHVDAKNSELWLTGPVPGSFGGVVAITNSGKVKKNFALDKKASGIKDAVAPEKQADVAETVSEPAVSSTPKDTTAAVSEQKETK